MAVENIWFFCLLSLGYWGLSVQEKPVSVELSCRAGPVLVVLEPGSPLLLDCHLGASETPLNVSWLRDGRPVAEGEGLRALPNGSLLVAPAPRDSHTGSEGIEGGYSCLSASAFGALTSRTINLHLASLSRFHQDPQAQTVPVGGSVRFECHVEGQPSPDITWERDQLPLPAQPRYISLPNGVLQVLGVRGEDEGVYRCAASNTARKRFSQDATLTINPGPSPTLNEVVIVAPPRNSTVVMGRPAVMECMAQGHPKPLVSWSRQDGKPIATDVVVLETNLVIPDARRHHAGVYVCRANKPKTREFVIAAAELRVLAPPVILQSPETVSLSRGNTARFLCNSSGEPPPSLRWLKNGTPVRANGRVKTQGPGVLLINQLGPDDAGYYQCIARNSLGSACATARLSVIVREGLPSSPRRLQATPRSSTVALLTWERPEQNSDQIIGFSVHYQRTTGDNMEYQFAVNNDTTECQVKELLPHTAYTFYVVAYSPMGASRPSLPVIVEMLEDVPSAPPQPSLLSTSPTDIRVMWLPLSSLHSRGAVNRYRIDYSTLEPAERMDSVVVLGNETQVTLRGLQPNQTYQLRMAAGTRAGFGLPSEWAKHHTPDLLNLTMVLFAPTELKVRAKMSSLHVTWQPPPNHTQISGYKLSCKEAEPEELANEESPVKDRLANEKRVDAHPIKLRKRVKHHEVTGLTPDRLYEVKVWAFNKQTEGYAAVWKGRTEKPLDRVRIGYLPPLPPSSVKALANSSTSIWLRWEKPRSSNARIINYTIRCSPAGITNASLVSYYTSSSQEILLGALKPFTRYKLAVQSNGIDVGGPFSSTVEQSTLSDRPSSPPVELQLSALDGSSVLVSWNPPLEPNGVIVSYSILYNSNLTQPDTLWTNLSHHGSITSVEVQGLLSGTRYFFKMGACTEMGVGPFSPVKDVHTPQKSELDIHAVTGIIVGVCLGLLCICSVCVSASVTARPGGLDSSALTPQYRRGARPVPAAPPKSSDCHELETLMPPSTREAPPLPPPAEPTEEHCLMGNAGAADDGSGAEAKPAWNGSVSRNWANRITRYRDTLTDDSPTLLNGATTDNSKGDAADQLYSLCSNQVEAEVIVHSELADPQSEASQGFSGSRGPCFREEAPFPKQPATAPLPTEAPRRAATPPPPPSSHACEALSNRNGPLEPGRAQTGGLTNGFHLPTPPQPGTAAPPLENGDSSRLLPPGKVLPPGALLPASPPSSFASSGLVHSTSGAHSFLCP